MMLTWAGSCGQVLRRRLEVVCCSPCLLMRRLTKLTVSQSGVGDVGLAAMGALTRLRELDLSNNWALTDDGLAALSGLSSLQWLNLTGSNQARLVSASSSAPPWHVACKVSCGRKIGPLP